MVGPDQRKRGRTDKMAKLTTVRLTLVLLQLTSMTIASVIIIIYYNPWISRIIDEAERSGNTGRSLADQIRRTDNEELVIFLMSATTILVSLLGIIGALRNYEHNHCLLNFYMSTMIIFLFVVFVALCGTIWEVIGKLHRSSTLSATVTAAATAAVPISFHDSVHLNSNSPYAITEPNNHHHSMEMTTKSNYSEQSIITRPPAPPSNSSAAQSQQVSWWYIAKSIILISCSAILYATSLRLTRKILESSDDRYLSANEDIDDDLNSENGSHAGIHYTHATASATATTSPRYPYHFNYTGNVTDIYHGANMIGASKSSLGSQFRTIL